MNEAGAGVAITAAMVRAKFYSLDEINQAAEDSEKGTTIKPVIRMQ